MPLFIDKMVPVKEQRADLTREKLPTHDNLYIYTQITLSNDMYQIMYFLLTNHFVQLSAVKRNKTDYENAMGLDGAKVIRLFIHIIQNGKLQTYYMIL